MSGSSASTLADWSSSRWSGSDASRVLVIGETRLEIAPSVPTQIEAPSSVSELRDAIGVPLADPFESALIFSWGRGVELPGLVDLVRRAVRPGGTVAFVVPIALVGWRGARGAVLGLIRRQRPVPLEEICAALLLGRLVDIRARALEGATGHSIVWATVPPLWREDVESSAVVPSMER